MPQKAQQWRAKVRVLRHRNFRRFFAGYVPSKFGTAMASIALAFAVLDNGGSAVDLGYVFTAGIVPQVVLMIAGGVISDRLGRRTIMLGADLLRTFSQASLAILLFVERPQIWVFCVLAAAVGVGDAFFSPAFNGLTVEIAPTEELGDANALFGMATSAAQVAGPALAGILVAAFNPATVLTVDAVSYAASAVALAGLRLPPLGPSASTSMVRDLVEGWNEFRSRTWLWATTVQFALFNLLTWGPFLLLGPVLSKAYLDGARSWGVIMGAYGVGSIAGGLMALGRQPRRPLLIATLATFCYPAPLLLLAAHLPTAAVAAGALVAGVGSAGFNIFWSASLQQHIPQEAQARVFSFAIVGAYSAGPVAYAASGSIAALVGARTLLGFGAVSSILISLIVLAVPAVRTLPWPRPAP